MTRLLVTGASGLLGINLALEATRQGYQVTGTTHQNPLRDVPFTVYPADLAQPGSLEALFAAARPDAVIHCAALANLEAAESDPALAWRLNAELPGQLAQIAHHQGLPFIHISTDAVFDGAAGPYRETDRPNPPSAYGRSKLAGEQAVSGACPEAMITRVNFYGWSPTGKRSVAEFFYNNLSANQKMMGFTDVFFCPLLVNDLAALLLLSLGQGLSGIYHVVSRECLSKFAFGVAVARQFGLDETLIRPVSVEESGLVARRSPNLTLNTDKLASALNLALPDQAAGLMRFFELHQSGYPQKIRSYLG